MLEMPNSTELIESVAHIVAAYVTNHKMETSEVPGLVSLVNKSLYGLSSRSLSMLTPIGEPAVPISESIKKDYIVCLEDGKKLKMLKRHLRTAYN